MVESADTRELWLPELRQRYKTDPRAERVVLRLCHPDGCRDFTLWLPPSAERFLCASAFDLLSVYSARELRFYCSEALRQTAEAVPQMFEKEPGLQKAVHIARRIYGGFAFRVLPLSEYAPVSAPAPVKKAPLSQKLRALCAAAEDKCCIGVDVGGSDIKTAASVDGRLVYTEEYDWDPASCPTAEAVLGPLMACVRRAVEPISAAGRAPDAIGLSFPDIVINDAIVGGETPKTRGIRENPALDYETEFAKFRRLKEELLALCAPGGRVRIINDGNMAAFTAAMELSAGEQPAAVEGGIVAHSLGTDLGTGWLRSDAGIPALPLELYDLLLDLGSAESAALPPEDLRSTRNENSRLPGLRRYLGQAAVYRLAWQRDPRLLEGFVRQEGEHLTVPTAPEDLRKPCLEHIMALASAGDEDAAAVFRAVGRHLAIVAAESEWLLGELPKERYLFGRFVKSRRCFALLREGFEELNTDIRLIAADEDMANTPLMRQLAGAKTVTVAQFGQAVGAIYYALL